MLTPFRLVTVLRQVAADTPILGNNAWQTQHCCHLHLGRYTCPVTVSVLTGAKNVFT